MGKPRMGICRLCGNYKEMTPEHIPPKAAFNRSGVLVETLDDFIRGYKPHKFRQGMNEKSLCSSCNSTTGDWYAPSLIAWCHQGMSWVEKSNGILYLPYFVQPLNVIKQILVMSVALLPENVTVMQRHEELRYCLLRREDKYIPPQYKVYVYLNVAGKPRLASNVAVTNLNAGVTPTFVLAEFAMKPFGYCVTIESERRTSLPQFQQLSDITWCSNYDYDEFHNLELRLAARETHEPFPLDYRTSDEIERQS